MASLSPSSAATRPLAVRLRPVNVGVMLPKMMYEIDGARFTTLEGFYDEVSRVLIPGASWGHNLDAFNDILRGGFGTPPGDRFTLRIEALRPPPAPSKKPGCDVMVIAPRAGSRRLQRTPHSAGYRSRGC